jgi:quinolinate synthase
MFNGADITPAGVDQFPLRRPALQPAQIDALTRDILALKRKHNAVILAHNYQIAEIQDVADVVGDSLGLSQYAARTDADVIVFCGVHFMAETAKILNPGKIVVLPDLDAGCSLEESCPADKLAALQATNPNFYTVTYINCSAAVKALSDVICTSGNAVKIVNHAPKDRDLLFVPDENLGSWVMEQTGRPMTLWKGNCYVHVEWTHAAITRIRQMHPDAPVVAHPECPKAGMLHRLKRECPDKIFIPAPTDRCACNECRFMKLNTLEKLHDCLLNLAPRVELPRDIIERARRPIERMLEISALPN